MKQLYSNSKILNSELSTNNTDKPKESQASADALFGFRTIFFDIEIGPQLGVVTGAAIH